MKNFKVLAVASLLAITGIVGVAKKAQSAQCVYGHGYQMCFEQTGQSGRLNRWNVQLTNNHTQENMTVICNGNYVSDWRSNGGFSQSEARGLAGYFCAL